MENKHIALSEEEAREIREHRVLIVQDIFVAIAATLFLISLFIEGHAEHTLRGVAYFLGACAYVCEILEVTDFFRIKKGIVPMFMPYVFGVLYVILGFSYLLG